MKFHQTLDNILGKQSKLKVLRVLADSQVELSGREIARSSKLAQRIVHASLLSLFKSGLVLLRKSGKSKLYKLNPHNIIIKEAILPLFNLEKSLLQRIVKMIKKSLPKILSVMLFGSVAENRERENSDLDLLLVLPEAASLSACEENIDQLNFEVARMFGNGLSPICLKKSDFIKRYKTKDALIRSIAEKGIILYGKTALELVYNG